jgi:transposase-like protein
MAKKGQKFQRYSETFKHKAVKMYEEGKSYREITKELGIRSKTQVKNWGEKYRNQEAFTDRRGKTTKKNNPFMGRPRTKFQSVEEERDYLKAQVEYLKKRYPNLHKERGSRENEVSFGVVSNHCKSLSFWLLQVGSYTREEKNSRTKGSTSEGENHGNSSSVSFFWLSTYSGSIAKSWFFG